MHMPKSLTVYTIDDFETLEKSRVAVFTMEDGKVESKYFDDAYKDLVSTAVDPDSGKALTPEDGEAFMKALPGTFARSTTVQVEIDED